MGKGAIDELDGPARGIVDGNAEGGGVERVGPATQLLRAALALFEDRLPAPALGKRLGRGAMLRHVAYRGDDEGLAGELNGPDLHIDRKLAAVPAPAEQLQPDAHLAQPRRVEEGEALAKMARSKALRQQGLDGLPGQRLAALAEERGSAVVDIDDAPAAIADQYGVRIGVEDSGERRIEVAQPDGGVAQRADEDDVDARDHYKEA